MRSRRRATALAFAAAMSLAWPAAAPTRVIAVPLCGGGSLPMPLPGQPGGDKSCHACLTRDAARTGARTKVRTR